MVYTAVYINIGWNLGANINTLLTTKYDMLVTTKKIAITIELFKFLINDAFLTRKGLSEIENSRGNQSDFRDRRNLEWYEGKG